MATVLQLKSIMKLLTYTARTTLTAQLTLKQSENGATNRNLQTLSNIGILIPISVPALIDRQ